MYYIHIFNFIILFIDVFLSSYASFWQAEHQSFLAANVDRNPSVQKMGEDVQKMGEEESKLSPLI